MTAERINKYLEDRGLSRVDTNYPGASLYKLGSGSSVCLVFVIADSAVNDLLEETYEKMIGRIRNAFLSANQTVNMITLFVTSKLDKAKAIAGNNPFWIVDGSYGRVIVYENQPEDFLGMKRDLEGLVSMLKADELKREQAERTNTIYKEGAYKSMEEEWVKGSGRSKEKKTIYLRNYKNYPYVTIGIMIINAIVLLIVNLFGTVLGTDSWSDLGAVSWMKVVEEHEFYRLITCMFLHGDIGHITGNMIILFAAGELLEFFIGHFKFALVYLLGGLIAGGGSVYYYYVNHQYVVSIGASGAVFAVVGGMLCFAFLTRKSRNISFNQIGASRIALFAIYSLYSGFANEGTDNAAHVAGLLGGILVYLIIYTFWDYKNFN